LEVFRSSDTFLGQVKIIHKFEVQFEEMPWQMQEWDYDKLLIALKFGLVQLALLLEFEERLASLDNPISMQTFAMLLRDSVGLYGALLQGFLRVTEEFRELCRTEAEDAADLYDKFIDYSDRLINSFYPKCGRYTKQLPQFDPAPEAMLKELDRYARDEAPDAPPAGRKARLLDRARLKQPAPMKGVREFDARDLEDSRGSRRSVGGGAPVSSAPAPRARGERERNHRDKSARRRGSDDVSFEDIPKSWLANPPTSGGVGTNRVSSGRVRKDKGEYDYSDEARSDEVSRSSDDHGQARNSRGLPPTFSPKQMFDEPQRQLDVQDAQQRAFQQQAQAQVQQHAQQQAHAQAQAQAQAHAQQLQLQLLQAQQQQLMLEQQMRDQQQREQQLREQQQREQQMREQQMREQQLREQQQREQQQQLLRQQAQAAPQSYDPFAASSGSNNNFSAASFSGSNNNSSGFGGGFQPSSHSNFSAVDGSFGNSSLAPPLSGGNSGVGSSLGAPARASGGGSILYDPFASPASPASSMSAASSLPYDPFSPSRLSVTPGSSLTPAASAGSPFFPQAAPARLFPASPFDPSLPAVGKSAEVGPNVLDARQFDPFQVVNL
jgi:hypothetical protein